MTDQPAEPGWIEGWRAAMDWLATYKGADGIALAEEMLTRLPDPGTVASCPDALAARSQPPAERAGGEVVAAVLAEHADCSVEEWGAVAWLWTCGIRTVSADGLDPDTGFNEVHRLHVAEQVAALSTGTAAECPTCGPAATEPHPRRLGATRCGNCKEWLAGTVRVKALVRPRHLRPHAVFGDDPSGWCGCAECDPRDDCACQSCLAAALSTGTATRDEAVVKAEPPCRSFWHGARGHECIPAAALSEQPTPEDGEDRG